MFDLRHFATTEHLKDGTPVTVRAVRPDDKERIRNAFHELEPETIYTRFFRSKAELSQEELRHATEVDFDREVALVVTLRRDDQEIVIGGARYDVYVNANGTRSAEVAFTVEEDYQGQGIASTLLRHLIRIARSKGLTRLEAEVLPGNRSMLTVFSRSGLPMKMERFDDVMYVVLTLNEEAP